MITNPIPSTNYNDPRQIILQSPIRQLELSSSSSPPLPKRPDLDAVCSFFIFHLCLLTINLILLSYSLIFFRKLNDVTFLPTYNDYVSNWITSNSNYYHINNPKFNISIVTRTTKLTNLNIQNQPAIENTNPPPIIIPETNDIIPYNNYLQYQYIPLVPFIYKLGSSADSATFIEFTITANNTSNNFIKQVPIWFTYTYAQTCSGGAMGHEKYCSCDNNGIQISGTTNCQLWYQLHSVCIIYDPINHIFMNDLGCSVTTPTALQYYTGTNTQNKYGSMYYTSYTAAPIVGKNYTFQPTITIRSIYDPYVQLILLTNGSFEFPMVQSTKLTNGILLIIAFCILSSIEYYYYKKWKKNNQYNICCKCESNPDITTAANNPYVYKEEEEKGDNDKVRQNKNSIPNTTITSSNSVLSPTTLTYRNSFLSPQYNNNNAISNTNQVIPPPPLYYYTVK